MKKLYSCLLCLLLAAALALPVFAEEPPSGGGDGDTTTCSHTYDAGTVTVSPTCGQAGTKTCTCTKCGATKTEPIDATGNHTWNNGTVTTAPTCQTAGVRTFTCPVCNSTRTEAIPIDPSAHSYGAWNAGQEGSHSRTCVCGASESGAHSFDITATVPATCKEEGATAYGCSVCGRIEYKILPKLTTHTYDNDCDPECNVCGFTRDTAHKFSDNWSKSVYSHWHACTVCGEKKDQASHIPGPAATEEKAQLCLTCGYVLTPKRNHVHDFETTLSSDEAGHWYACTGCEEQKDFEAHSFGDSCASSCDVCGYVADAAHAQAEAWSSDETGHWYICPDCGEVFQYSEHISEDGQLCSVCGFALRSAEETHVHEGGAAWFSDETSHWQVCECGEETGREAHLWEKGGNRKVLRCSACGMEKAQSHQGDSLGIVLIVLIVVAVVAMIAIVILLILLKKPPKKPGKYAR